MEINVSKGSLEDWLAWLVEVKVSKLSIKWKWNSLIELECKDEYYTLFIEVYASLEIVVVGDRDGVQELVKLGGVFIL